MQVAALLLIGLATTGVGEYTRSLDSRRLDQATLDAEGYGEKKGLKREARGLRITVAPGEKETGWKTPQALKIGGNFTIVANLVIGKLCKPAQEDGVAVGIALALQNADQPEATFIRLVEPGGAEVYRSIEQQPNNAMQQQQQQMMQMQMNRGMRMQQAAKPPKPPRPTFPAAGQDVRIEIRREANLIRYQVLDGRSKKPRYLGQATLGPNDVAAVKLFASNRNGAEPINVLLRDLTVRADRLTGLGTAVHTVFGEVVYADPTAIEKNVLILGGDPKTPPGANPTPNPGATPGAGAMPPGTSPAAGPGPASPNSPPPATTAPAPAATPAATTTTTTTAPAATQAKAEPPVVKTTAVATVAAVENKPPAAKAKANADDIPDMPFTNPDEVRKAVTKARGSATAAKPKEPKARVPLDEVESIHFERTLALAGRFIGQPNIDLTMPGLSAKKDTPATKKDTPATKKAEPATKKEEPAAKKEEPAAKVAVPPARKGVGVAKVAQKAAAKEAAKKADAADDLLAPPPGTTVAAVAKVEKLVPKKNGIRDVYLILAHLRNVEITQVTVNCQTDKGATAYRLDTTNSQDWPLVLRRGGTEEWADLYLEPPPGDSHQKTYNIVVTYKDNQNANAAIQVGDHHTDPKLAVDPKQPLGPRPAAWVYLTGDEKLYGKIESLGAETLRLTTSWQDHLDVPLDRVVAIHVGLATRKESDEAFAKRLKVRGTEDLLLARTKDGEVVAIPGIMEGVEGDRLKFVYQEKPRTLPMEQVEGVILAARPEARPAGAGPGAVASTFTMPGGLVVSGRWKDLDTVVWKVEMPWGQVLNLPAAEVQGVRFRGGKMTYLSDLKPSKVEETPFFGRKLPWRADANLLGGPLVMAGQTYERGLAVHSRSTLTYDLDRRYATFEALVGFDDEAKGKGRVACRVLADGKELYANPDLRADGPPVKLALSVAGAEQLRLVVDFGRDQDTGDRVIWANPRLYRRPPPGDTASAARADARP